METKGIVSCKKFNRVHWEEKKRERYPDNGRHAENNGENNKKDLLRSRQGRLQSANMDKAWIWAR